VRHHIMYNLSLPVTCNKWTFVCNSVIFLHEAPPNLKCPTSPKSKSLNGLKPALAVVSEILCSFQYAFFVVYP